MLGGIIAGALAGGAKGVNELATRQLDKQDKLDLAREMSEIELEKQKSLARFNQDLDVEGIGRKAVATADAALATAPTAGKAVVERRVAEAKGVRESGVLKLEADNKTEARVADARSVAESGVIDLEAGNEKTKYDAGAPLREAMRNEKGEDIKAETAARTAAELLATKQLGGDKAYLAAVSALAAAKEGPAARAQAGLASIQTAMAKITLENAKRVETLRQEFQKPETLVARKEAIREEIQLLTGKDNDNFLPVPLKDLTGAVTGYQVFDKRRGEFVEPRTRAGDPSSTPTAGGPAADKPWTQFNPNKK